MAPVAPSLFPILRVLPLVLGCCDTPPLDGLAPFFWGYIKKYGDWWGGFVFGIAHVHGDGVGGWRGVGGGVP